MIKRLFGALLIGSAVMLGACAQPDPLDESEGAAQYNANGELISGNPELGGASAAPEPPLRIRVLADKNSITTGGSDSATITALVTDEDNVAVAGQSVSFRSSGGILQGLATETDANGEAQASLVLAQDFEQQEITVTVSAGDDVGTVILSASGTRFTVSGPESLVRGDTAELTVTLVAGNDEPIANREVLISSSYGHSLSDNAVSTDSEGRVVIAVENVQHDDEITFSALGGSVTSMYEFDVAEDLLTFAESVQNAEYEVGTNNAVTVTWMSNTGPVVDEQLRFSITSGQLASSAVVRTNEQGNATVLVTSLNAGPATVAVEAVAGGNPATQVGVEFIATIPSELAVDSSSSRVATGDTSTIAAVVTDSSGNPVKNQKVMFSSTNLKGGQISPASATTDNTGTASVIFTAGDQATVQDEIEIHARLVENNGIQNSTFLTVAERVLNVTIGTSNLIEERSLATQYVMPFVVQVADGSATPLENATVELSVEPVHYYKGTMRLVNRDGLPYSALIENWTATSWSRHAALCDSEDDNGNRLLDPGEDFNGNSELDPQDPVLLGPVLDEDIATLVGGSLQTDARGSGFFEMVYPASTARWAEVKITARAQALGAEAEATFVTSLPLLATRANNVSASPPNARSPYGISFDCSDPD
ncbi:MAG: Ig-like domain-containing protein [Gammaproteobacteria bacterium]|nr:Ig-like domain-containing protein [Gammaproteobacteria bacterium]